MAGISAAHGGDRRGASPRGPARPPSFSAEPGTMAGITGYSKRERDRRTAGPKLRVLASAGILVGGPRNDRRFDSYYFGAACRRGTQSGRRHSPAAARHRLLVAGSVAPERR